MKMDEIQPVDQKIWEETSFFNNISEKYTSQILDLCMKYIYLHSVFGEIPTNFYLIDFKPERLRSTWQLNVENFFRGKNSFRKNEKIWEKQKKSFENLENYAVLYIN